MSAAGSPVMREWRRGDLVLYSRNNMPVGSRPPAPADECWIEKTLGGTRFRLKQQSAADFASPCLHSVIAGDILPTVSRRDPRRGQADVWTSGNRLFKCFGTAVLAVIIDALNAGGRVIELVASHLGRSLAETEQQAVARAAFQVLDVVKWESVELQRIELGCRMARELGPAIDQSSALRRAG